MFKWSVRIYKNINWKEECVNKEFNNEKDFDKFISKNPDLKTLGDWENMSIPESFYNINDLFEEALIMGNVKFFKDIEKDLDNLVGKSKKLLWK